MYYYHTFLVYVWFRIIINVIIDILVRGGIYVYWYLWS